MLAVDEEARSSPELLLASFEVFPGEDDMTVGLDEHTDERSRSEYYHAVGNDGHHYIGQCRCQVYQSQDVRRDFLSSLKRKKGIF